MSPELLQYRSELVTLTHKSQDAFEKQLSYISAGSLALSMAFIKDIVMDLSQAECKGLLTAGWILLGLTLLVNLISHILAAHFHSNTIKEIDAGKYSQGKAANRIKKINRINICSIVTLLGGLFLIVYFVSLNIYDG